MSVGNEEAFGHQLCRKLCAALDQFRHRSHGHADVVLEAAAGAALCFRHAFPQAPEIRALFAGSGDGRIERLAGFDGRSQGLLEQGIEVVVIRNWSVPPAGTRARAVVPGLRAPGTCARTRSRADCGISSQLATRSALASRNLPSNAIAARGSGTLIHAVATLRGCGNNLRQAAVITPSVPSLPIMRPLKS